MSPPKQIVEFWKEESDWIKRFQRSTEINGFLCKVPIFSQAHTLWTPAAIKQFNTYMKGVKQLSPGAMTLYRGTTTFSPTYHPLCETMVNCQYMSTTKSKAIAKEFGRKGYIHVLNLDKGVAIFDMKESYGNDPVKREQEVLLYPGAHMKLEHIEGNIFTWHVSMD